MTFYFSTFYIFLTLKSSSLENSAPLTLPDFRCGPAHRLKTNFQLWVAATIYYTVKVSREPPYICETIIKGQGAVVWDTAYFGDNAHGQALA